MSGSLTWRSYTGDNGASYAVFRDESNSDSVASTGVSPLLSNLVVGSGGLSNLIKPRYVNTTLSTNPVIRKRFIIGTIAAYSAIVAGTTITEATTPVSVWNVTSKVGEKQRIPSVADTGQTDGTPLK